MSLIFKGVHQQILDDQSPEIDAEGALSSGKTVVALWKQLELLKNYPGIWILMCRWTDDSTSTLLRPAFEQLARIHGTTWEWNQKEHAYEFPNGSRAFAFGLKTQSQKAEDRYGKIRGLAVSAIYVDQAEQLPGDIASELRFRLRPDIEANVKGSKFPRQLLFTPNPVNNTGHWIADQFPITNKIKGRKYYALSLYDNSHNLPPEMIQQAEATWPREHPKFRTMILGQRGLNVIGDAIYEGLFKRALHVRPLMLRQSEDAPLLEGYTVGKHNPCWVVAQRTYAGGINFLGGVMAKGFALEDFVPLIERTRAEWFPASPYRALICSAPMGETPAHGSKFTLLQILRASGIQLRSKPEGNGPEVQLAMIEYLSGLLRRRMVDGEEALGVEADPRKWLQVTKEGETEIPFLAFGFEGGYCWSDHFISVSQKELRQPNQDDEYANAMESVEQIMLNFCVGRPTPAEAAKKASRLSKGQTAFPSGDGAWAI